MSTSSIAISQPRTAVFSRVCDFIELTKPRMNFLVLITTLVGFYMAGEGGMDWRLLLATLIGRE